MRHTRSHTKNRRSHHALAATTLVKDEKADTLRLPHRLDEKTGMYRGKQVVPADTLKRREERAKARQASTQAEEAAPVEGLREPAPAHQHVEEAQQKPAKEGLLGRFTKGRAQARSGTGS